MAVEQSSSARASASVVVADRRTTLHIVVPGDDAALTTVAGNPGHGRTTRPTHHRPNEGEPTVTDQPDTPTPWAPPSPTELAAMAARLDRIESFVDHTFRGYAAWDTTDDE